MGTLGSIFLIIVVSVLLICAMVAICKKLITWAFQLIGFLFQAIVWIITLPFVWIGKALFGH